jgi:hypothetical protein
MIERVVGNYRIVEKLGEGGMGTVYKAVDLMLEREVAIKAIRPELTREAEIVERFHAEAKMLARVSHPAIATIYSFFVDGGDLFLAMEFVRGVSLSRLLQRDGPMAWEQAVPLLAVALDGIEQAHRAGIVHRDLKPDNLMITASGAVKVMDFGIARVIGSGRLTRTGLLIGTLRYMAPEQIRGEEVDRRTDVYALGTVLYEMVTGRVPFDGSSDYAVLKAQIEEIPTPPSAALPALPAWLDHAILRALAKEPEQRFQTVDEMRRFLLGQGSPLAAAEPAMVVAIGDQPTLAREPTPRPTPAVRPSAAGALAPTPRPTPAVPPPAAGELAPTIFRPAAQPRAGSQAPAAQDGSDGAAGSHREVGGDARRRFSPLLVAAMALLVIIVAGAAIYRLRTPAGQGAATAAAGRQGAPGAGGAAATTAASPAPAATAPAAGPPGGALPQAAGGGRQGNAGPGGAGGSGAAGGAGGTRSEDGAASAGAAAAARSAPRARRRPESAAAATRGKDDAERQEPAAAEGAASGAGNAKAAGEAGDADAQDDVERFGGLPAGELRRLAVELQRESAYLRNVYVTTLAQKERAGSHPSGDEERLGAELKEFQTAAEQFSQPFETGFFSRARARLGRLTRGEDERSHVLRLARALAGSGARVDDLLREATPEEAVRRLWSQIRQQTMRVAEICGG